MAGENSAIWRTTTTSVGTEAAAIAANKILFNESPIITTGGYVHSTEISWRLSVPENEKINANFNNVQDMGLDGLDIQVTGSFKDSSSTSSTNAIAKLVTWMKERKKLQVNFKKGRFGLRLDDMPQFNVVPSSTFGYVLAGVRAAREPGKVNVAGVIMTLRFSGDDAGVPS